MESHWKTDHEKWANKRAHYYLYGLFPNASRLYEHVKPLQAALAREPGMDLVPLERLHMTLCGIGPCGEIALEVIKNIASQLADELAVWRAVQLPVGGAVATKTSVSLDISSPTAITQLQSKLRNIVAQHVPARSQSSAFWPHIAVAYSNRAQDPGPYLKLTEQQPNSAVSVELGAVHIVKLFRSNRTYDWEVVKEIPLQGG